MNQRSLATPEFKLDIHTKLPVIMNCTSFSLMWQNVMFSWLNNVSYYNKHYTYNNPYMSPANIQYEEI